MTELVKRANPSSSRRWFTLIAVCSGTLYIGITTSVTSVSLPAIADNFGATMTLMQWVLEIYLLVSVSLMLCVGYLADIFGRKRIFIVGTLIFALGSLLCGSSPSALSLVIFRGLQAIGAAMVSANGGAIITGVFPSAGRGKALGLQATTAAVGLSIGPSLGGLLVDSFGWRWSFYVTVPLSLLTALLAILFLSERFTAARQRRHFDIGGALTLFVSLASFLLALDRGTTVGWTSPTTILLGLVFVGGIAIFFHFERRAILPTVDLSMLRHRLFASASATGMLSYVALFSTMFLAPFHLTKNLGYSYGEAGALMTAIPVAMAISSPLAGSLSDRFGSRELSAVGMSLCSLGIVLLSGVGQSDSYFAFAAWLAMVGLGLGVMTSPNNSAIMGCVPSERLSMASAFAATTRHLGGALGVAIAGMVFTIRLTTYQNAPGIITGSPTAGAAAFRDACLIIAILVSIGIVTALLQRPPSASRRSHVK